MNNTKRKRKKQYELGGRLMNDQQANKARTVSIMDLGKMLLHCAKEGETQKVHELMSRGAPFTTDWVCCVNKNILIATQETKFFFLPSNFSSAERRCMWLRRGIITTPVKCCCGRELAKMPERKSTKRLYISRHSKGTYKSFNCCSSIAVM